MSKGMRRKALSGPAADRKASVAKGELLARTPGAPGAPGRGSATLAAGPPVEFKRMHECEWTLIHKSGRRVGLEAAAGTIEVGGKVQSIGIFCDRSEQERLEDELKTRTLQQAALVDLGQRALAGMDLPVLMDQAVSVLTRTLDIEFARVLELAPDARSFNGTARDGWEEAHGGHATGELPTR